jgi:hypothetical protein
MQRADPLTERAPMDPSDEPTTEPEPSEPERLTAPPVAPRETSGVELDIGPRVTAVFTAAEKAAQHIVEMAREEAEDVRRRAETEAETHVTQRRYQAEEEAVRLIAEARAQADQIRSAAEEAARQTEESARRREVRIREETKLLEERVEWAREGLREVADRLREAEALVTIPGSEPSRGSPTAPPPPRRDVPPAAAMSGSAEPAGVEPGDELVEPAPERPEGANRAQQPW